MEANNIDFTRQLGAYSAIIGSICALVEEVLQGLKVG